MMKLSMSGKIMLIWVIIIVLSFTGCDQKRPSVDTTFKDEANQLTVVATFYPLAEFAYQIGKDKIEVINLVPTGVEPHDWEPKPRDIETIMSADLFIYNGAGFEAWAEKAAKQLNKSQVLCIASNLKLDNSLDPHVWLDPLYAAEIVKIISTKIVGLDNINKDYYNHNSQRYQMKLMNLHRKFEKTISAFVRDEFVVTHKSFGYLAKRYGLKQTSISGISPQAEPSPKELQQLITTLKNKKIDYVFFETLVDPRLATTLAAEVKAKTLVLNPIEGLTSEEINAEDNYISIMERNLDNLSEALSRP